MNIREWFFFIFQARYYVTRMKLETLHGISRVVEENFLQIQDDYTLQWRESTYCCTRMGFFQASIWVFQLRRSGTDYCYSKVTLDEHGQMHYLSGYSNTLFI